MSIRSKPATDKYRDNFDRVFRNKVYNIEPMDAPLLEGYVVKKPKGWVPGPKWRTDELTPDTDERR